MILDSVEILRRLVAFPTVSRDTNLPLIDWVRNYLADFGIESHLVPDSSGLKSNLFASLGPMDAGGIVLSGHTDVVPVEGQTWNSNPFELTTRDSRLYGRGACDMKGFIAAVLAGVPSWKRAPLERPVHLMFSYDEEVGCLGVSSMIAAARQRLPQPAAVIVGEPTGMRLATQHKGVCIARSVVMGSEAHSSLTHRGASAVMLAAELVADLGRISQDIASKAGAGRNGFDPPYTTISVNQIRGGTAVNMLAAWCEFSWDVRALPGESPQPILDQLMAYANRRVAELRNEGKECRIETTLFANAPPLRCDERATAVKLLRAASGDCGDAICVPFGSEAGYFQEVGWSAVVCGPGSIEQAHKPDEFIERSQLAACERLLGHLVRQLH